LQHFPYYNGDDVGFDSGVPGLQDGTPVTATMSDGPGEPDASFPAGVVTLEYDFETAVFCASGDNSGEYVGVVNWKWVKTKGGAATASLVSTSRGTPSSAFTTAVSQWTSNHGFALP
jgi:hypothetical protein